MRGFIVPGLQSLSARLGSRSANESTGVAIPDGIAPEWGTRRIRRPGEVGVFSNEEFTIFPANRRDLLNSVPTTYSRFELPELAADVVYTSSNIYKILTDVGSYDVGFNSVLGAI